MSFVALPLHLFDNIESYSEWQRDDAAGAVEGGRNLCSERMGRQEGAAAKIENRKLTSGGGSSTALRLPALTHENVTLQERHVIRTGQASQRHRSTTF